MKQRKWLGALLVTLVPVFLHSCAAPGPKAVAGGVYQCSYKNTKINHIYTAMDPHEANAVQQAYYACQRGAANWSCYFRYCVQVRQ